MDTLFNAIPVTDRVYWVGAIDWGIREFHGYATPRGTTYNAYLIMADKPILVDTVKAPFMDQMLGRIASITDPANIDTIISNHSEMDHSGGLPAAVRRLKPEQVLASTLGVKALQGHFGSDLGNLTAVRDGATVTVGGAELQFLETRMLHWPDSMFTYFAADRLLFSQDAFGMHLASTQRFVDELPFSLIEREAAKYYANILMPMGKLIAKLKARLEDLALPIDVIATDHGPIWRRDLDKIVSLYGRWAERAPTRKAVVVYDTMWGSTAKMAQAVCEGLVAGGSEAKLLPMGGSHRSDVATEVLDAGALIVGSPTLNRTLFPTLADLLCYLKGLAPKNLLGAAFGSYGWSPQAVGQLTAALTDMGVEVVSEGVECSYVPDPEALRQCRALGLRVAERLADGVNA